MPIERGTRCADLPNHERRVQGWTCQGAGPPCPQHGGPFSLKEVEVMTKEQLQAWFVANAALLMGLSKWMWGPLGFVKVYLTNLAAMLNAIAQNDQVLNVILTLLNQGQLALPAGHAVKPAQHEVAMLQNPSDDLLVSFRDSQPGERTA